MGGHGVNFGAAVAVSDEQEVAALIPFEHGYVDQAALDTVNGWTRRLKLLGTRIEKDIV